MCGVIGILLRNVDVSDITIIKNLFIQTMIRGKHATGVSFLKNNQITTISEPITSKEFIDINDPSDWINEDGNIYCIGHTRYSTSDLEYNQPIGNINLSIVHNGVISQESPEKWKSIFGYDVKTKNDSELLFKCVSFSEEPLTKFSDSSIASCILRNDRTISFFRNGLRPLYYSLIEKGIIVTSTKDIAKRSGIINSNKTEMNLVYNFNLNELKSYYVPTNYKDLQ